MTRRQLEFEDREPHPFNGLLSLLFGCVNYLKAYRENRLSV